MSNTSDELGGLLYFFISLCYKRFDLYYDYIAARFLINDQQWLCHLSFACIPKCPASGAHTAMNISSRAAIVQVLPSSSSDRNDVHFHQRARIYSQMSHKKVPEQRSWLAITSRVLRERSSSISSDIKTQSWRLRLLYRVRWWWPIVQRIPNLRADQNK
jgi:hypothetical protein